MACRWTTSVWAVCVATATVAEADPLACHSQTTRPVSEVIVPGASRSLPAQVVVVRDGDTLCLTGTLFDTGMVRGLRLVGGGEDLDPVVSIRLIAGERTTLLMVQHDGRGPLELDLYHMPREDVAVLRGREVVAPGQEKTLTLPGRQDRVGLASLRFALSEPPPQIAREHTRRRPHAHRVPPIAIYPLLGSRWLRLSGVDGALGREGYGSLPKLWHQYGLGGFVSMSWVQLTFGWARGSTSTRNARGQETALSYSEFDALAGWQLAKLDPFFADLSLGLAAGTLRLDRHAAGLPVDSCGSSTAKASVYGVVIEQGSEHVIASEAMLSLGIGYRLGYMRQLGASWDVDGGEDVDVSGIRGRVWLGFVMR